jgi:hypothetical protein
MSAFFEPNPPSRKEEDFPKTNTMPDGWIMDALMETYNGRGSVADRGVALDSQEQTTPVPTTGGNGKVNGKSHPIEAETPDEAENEHLFTRRLDPFPSASDLTGLGL